MNFKKLLDEAQDESASNGILYVGDHLDAGQYQG